METIYKYALVIMLFVVLGWAVVALWRTGSTRKMDARLQPPRAAADASGTGSWPLVDGAAVPPTDASSAPPPVEELFPETPQAK